MKNHISTSTKTHCNKSFIRSLIAILMIGASAFSAEAQSAADTSVHNSVGLFPKSAPPALKQITVTGYYRFFGTYTRQFLPYVINPIINDTAAERSLFIGDDSQLPNLLLNVAGRPSAKTSWGFDVYMFQFLQGNVDQAYSKQVVDSLRPTVFDPLNGQRLAGNLIVHLGINLSGTYNTSFGIYKLRVGGINWHALSDLTMASFKGYNRYVLFEDNPWDPVGSSLDTRYEKYYSTGAIDQDTRWGNRAFTGLILDGTALPGDVQFSALLGKSEVNGGFSQTPNFAYGGRLQKDLNNGMFMSLNTMNTRSYTDSLALETVQMHMITTEMLFDWKKWKLRTEIGMGQYTSPANEGTWGEAINAIVTTPSKSGVPQFNLQYFRIGEDVINNVGAFINTSVSEYSVSDIPAGSIGSSAVLQPFASAMVRLGQMTNNRQGLNINGDFVIGNLKIGAGTGFSAELNPVSNEITFGHPVNQLTRARFWRFAYPTGVGPYERYSVIYRDTYETVHLSDDSSGIAVNKKYFNISEFQAKYKTHLIGKELYVFVLGQYASAQRDFSPVNVTTEEAYIRQYVTEAELYYQLFSKIMLSGYLGYERTLGNYLTDIDEESRRPRNQFGNGYGLGIDIDMGKNARLYLRNRWFSFEDKSFADDHFEGQETVVEFKVFF